MLFNLQARWVALILVGIYALIGLGQRDVAGLISLAATAGFAYLCVRQLRGTDLFPWWPKAKPRARPASTPPSRGTGAHVIPFPASATSSAPAPRPAAVPTAKPAAARVPLADMAEVDALLDKIAHSGISSLTAAERARLDAAHQSLKRRSSSESP
jgi:hypothetical protein